MAPEKCGCIGLEYFCNQGDKFWTSDDKTILEKNRSKEADKKLLSIKEILNLIPGTN